MATSQTKACCKVEPWTSLARKGSRRAWAVAAWKAWRSNWRVPRNPSWTPELGLRMRASLPG
eukprot:7463341-Lingulodinium_polyedra.AAC.1